MGKLKIQRRHTFTIIRHYLIGLLDFLGLKNFVKRSVVRKETHLKEDMEIFKGNRAIIVFPNIPWGYRWQRPQQIFSRLGKKNYNIFYISPFTSDEEYLTEVSKGVYEVHVKSNREMDVLRDLKISQEVAIDFYNSIQRLIGEYLGDNALTFVLHPIWWNVVEKDITSEMVYDMMDLYAGFKEAKPKLVKAEEMLVKRSRLVLTTADNLYKYGKRLNKNVVMIRNGCDLERFSNLKENGELDAFKDRPIIGYFGAIHDWFDVEGMEYTIKNNPDKYFIFIGSIDSNKVRRLFKFKNAYFLGEVRHEELGGFLAYFNVCTIPFILNDLIKSTNPVKFYEYMASGKPVVSSRLPELEKYTDICYLYDNKEEFSKYIYKALYDDEEETVQKRKEVAKQNSWEQRVDSFEKVIKQIISSSKSKNEADS